MRRHIRWRGLIFRILRIFPPHPPDIGPLASYTARTMTDEQFWQIVEEMGWPDVHDEIAKRRFMERYDKETAEAFRRVFGAKLAELRKRSEMTEISDSMDDARAHTVGLGRAEFGAVVADPRRLRTRLDEHDYRESFAYCIPFDADYGFLTDDGYERFLRHARQTIDEIDSTDPDDIPPKLYRRFPQVSEVCELLAAKRWDEGVSRYHEYFGAGYADDWPMDGYAIPNFVKTLENYRL